MNTLPKYFLGIDGGGSKTHCALFSEYGEMLDFVEWGTTSHEFLLGGYLGLKKELNKMFSLIKERNNLDWDCVSLVYGMAGVDSERQRGIIGEYIREIGIKKFFLHNDSLLGVKSGTDIGLGICSMNGSGTGAGGIDSKGSIYFSGRLFELSGDYGGGKILGSEAIRATYDYLYHGEKKTIIAELLMQKMKVSDKEQLMEEIICKLADKTLETKAFASLLFEAADNGDVVSTEILEKSGKQCARDVLAVAKALDYSDLPEVPVILIGSLYTKIKPNHIVNVLQNKLAPHGQFKIYPLQNEPVIGAVCWAFEIDKIPYKLQEITNIIANR